MRGVPIAVIIKTASLLQDTGNLYASWPHKLNIGLRGFVPIFEGSLLFALTPENFVISIRIKWWVDINQVDASVGKLLELL
jgi:hypothetical protein